MEIAIIGGLGTLVTILILFILNAFNGKLKDLASKQSRFADKISIIDGELNGKGGIYIDLNNLKNSINNLQEKKDNE